jgi:exonuclease III
MKLLSWNCRGLGNPSAVRALKRLLKTQAPDVVFLMETRLKASDKKVKSSLTTFSLTNSFIVDCNFVNRHRSGGLAILWTNDVTLDILQFNKNHIDMYITSSNLNTSWYATGMYGHPYHSQKHLTCSTIYNLYQNRTEAKWLIFGDFNLILKSNEKLGGNGIDYHHTNMFNQTLNNCNLTDLGYKGDQFTWANNQLDNDHIKERLDRFCANSNWITFFPRYCNYHLLRYTSDHNPILLEFLSNEELGNTSQKRKIQRFEQI